MTTIIPLDNIAHADLKLAPGYGAQFGDAANQMPLFVNELAGAQRDYPILFRENDKGLQAFAILGLGRDTNLFLDGQAWQARYIPAIVRRGPFLLGPGEGDDPSVLIDMDSPRLAADGHPLFLEHGGHAPALESALAALRTLHIGAAMAEAMSTLFAETGLTEQADLSVTNASGQAIRFEGYRAVTYEKLASLSAADLEKLNKADLLGPAFHAASSLNNFQTIIALDAAQAG